MHWRSSSISVRRAPKRSSTTPIGLTDIPAHASIALFTFDGENPALLMGNSRFWTHSSEIGIRDQEQVNHCLRVPNHPFRVRFLNLMK